MFSKNLIKLTPLYKKPFFTTQDVANVMGFKLESARVFVNRYSKKGIFIKLKNNIYSFAQMWDKRSIDDYFLISCFLKVPSYISLLTALSYYEVTTQIPTSLFEGITILSSKKYDIKGIRFNYYKINKDFFNHYLKKGDFFIAEKEKAFVDSIYLYSFGKYSIDFDAIDYSKLDKIKILKILKKYPEKTKKIFEKLCKT